MSNPCAALSTKLAALSSTYLTKFDRLWLVDFEFRQNGNLRPVPVCMCAIEHGTGQEIFLWREQLLELRQAPFGTGPRDLIITFSGTAEFACFLQLGWPLPDNHLDLYVEVAAATNGNLAWWPHPKKRPGILAALSLFGLQGIDAGEKDAMRDLIMNHIDYTDEQRSLIHPYNRSDNIAAGALLDAMVDRIDMPYALHRGRYQKAAANIEAIGLPADTSSVAQLVENWVALKLDFIRRYGVSEFYDGTKFLENRLIELILYRGWETTWPLTPTGLFKTDHETLGRMAALRPEDPGLVALARLHSQLASFRMSKIASTIAADGYARIGLGSFWTRTGRNQPFGEDRVFLPSLPQWLHGLIKPPKGWACVELDWVAQEVAIAAALSGDQNMIADYLRGDCHTAFAIRSGLITDETTPEERSIIRNKQAKPVVLGSNYGMSPYGIQRKTKRSSGWARHIHRQHREVYRQFHSWLDDVVTQARFDQRIESVFGWPCFVGADTGTRSLMNYSSQASGADMMRHAAIVATEMGIVVNCPVHDSFRIMAPIEDLARTIKLMEEIMRAAGAAITGSFEVPVEVKTPVRYPERQADVFHPDKDRGHRMWTEIQARLASGELPKIKGLGEDDDEEEATQAS